MHLLPVHYQSSLFTSVSVALTYKPLRKGDVPYTLQPKPGTVAPVSQAPNKPLQNVLVNE